VPDGRPPLLADLAYEAESVTEVVDVVGELDGYDGAATVATYTVTYHGMDPYRTVALCDTADGRRCVAISEDADLARHAVSHELIGAKARVGRGVLDLV
jgi:acetyl-CoA C-acetyltransferase